MKVTGVMKHFILVFFFLTNMSFATSVTQSINTESQQALYTQLIDSKIENINNKIDNIKADLDNRTKNLDQYAFYITSFLGFMALVSLFGGFLSWRYFQDKKNEIDKIIHEIKQSCGKIKQISDDMKEDKAEIQEDVNKLYSEAERLESSENIPQDDSINIKSISNVTNVDSGVSSLLENESEHFTDPKHNDIKKLYLLLKMELLSLGTDVEVESKKFYLAFKRSKKNFVDVRIYQGHLTCFLNFNGKLVDPDNLAKNSDKWSHRTYEYKIREQSEIKYFITLAKQSYDDKIR
jgi:predicted transport protein